MRFGRLMRNAARTGTTGAGGIGRNSDRLRDRTAGRPLRVMRFIPVCNRAEKFERKGKDGREIQNFTHSEIRVPLFFSRRSASEREIGCVKRCAEGDKFLRTGEALLALLPLETACLDAPISRASCS